MKKKTLYSIAVSILFLLFGSVTASAQSQEFSMTAQVPFDFQVGEKLLPAGKYFIKRDSLSPCFLRIQSLEQNISVAVLITPHNLSGQQPQASLMFKAYEEKHFLSDVRFSGYDYGYSLFESKAEHRLAQAVRAHGQMIVSK